MQVIRNKSCAINYAWYWFSSLHGSEQQEFQTLTSPPYGGPVGPGYEQRFESKNEYKQRSDPRKKILHAILQRIMLNLARIMHDFRTIMHDHA